MLLWVAECKISLNRPCDAICPVLRSPLKTASDDIMNSFTRSRVQARTSDKMLHGTICLQISLDTLNVCGFVHRGPEADAC